MKRQCRGRSTLLIFALSLFAFVLGGCDFFSLDGSHSPSSPPEEGTSYTSSEPESGSSEGTTESYEKYFSIEYSDTFVHVGSTAYLRTSLENDYVLSEWESSNEEIATVEKGTVFGIKEGTVRVSASYVDADGKEYADSIEMEVLRSYGPVVDAFFSKKYYEIEVGESLYLNDVLIVAGDQATPRSYHFDVYAGDDRLLPGDKYSFDPVTSCLTGTNISIISVTCTVGGHTSGCNVQVKGEYSPGFAYEEKDDGTYNITGYYGHMSDVVVPDEWNGRPVSEVSCDFVLSGIESLTLGRNVTIFSGQASGLVSVNLERLETIGDLAFAGLQMESIELSPSLVSIGDYAFMNADNLLKVVIPSSTIEIGFQAFGVCAGLRYAYVPATVAEIDSHAFPEQCRVFTDAAAWPTGWDASFCDDAELAYFGVGAVLENPSGIRFALFDDSVSPFAAVFDYVGNDDEIVIPSEIEFDGGLYPVISILEAAFNDSSGSTIQLPSTIEDIYPDSLDSPSLRRVIVEGSLSRFESQSNFAGELNDDVIVYTTGDEGNSFAIVDYGGSFAVAGNVEYAVVENVDGSPHAVATAFRGEEGSSYDIVSNIEIDGVSYPVTHVDIRTGTDYQNQAGDVTIEEGVEILESNFYCKTLLIPSTLRGDTRIYGCNLVISPSGADLLVELGLVSPYGSGMPCAYSYAGWYGVVDGGLYSLYYASGEVVEAMFVKAAVSDESPDASFEVRASIEVGGIAYPVTALALSCYVNCGRLILPSSISSASQGGLFNFDYVFSRGKLETSYKIPVVENYAGSYFEKDGYSFALCRDEEHGDYLTLYDATMPEGLIVDIPSSVSYQGREYPVGVVTGDWFGHEQKIYEIPASVFLIKDIDPWITTRFFLIERGSTINDASIAINGTVIRDYLGSVMEEDGMAYGLFADESGEGSFIALYLRENRESLAIASEFEVGGVVYPVRGIDSAAFNYAEVVSIYIPGSIERLPESLFSHMDSLVSVTYGEGGLHIEDRVFEHCDALTNVSLPSTLLSIGASAFYLCDSMRELYVPESVETIGSYAFFIHNPACHIYLACNEEKPGFASSWDYTYGAVIVFGVNGGNANE